MPRRRFFPSAGTVTAPLLLAVAVAIVLTADAAKPPTTSASQQASGFLEAHNAARRAVGVPALRWDPRLEADARAYANTAAQRGRGGGACPLVHSHGGDRYGENLFRGSGGGGGWTPADVVRAWVDRERALYDRNTNSCRGGGGHRECGHYTQIVWRGTTAVGCAMVACAGGTATFAVCRYSPPGNYVGVKPY